MTPQLEYITHQDQLLAIIVRNKFKPDTHRFVTDDANPLQLGILYFHQGDQVAPHLHRSLIKTTHQNQEFLHLKSGQLKVEFYHHHRLVRQATLNPGDSLLQISGGHAFTATQNTRLITIKQGPYQGKNQEKKPI